MPRTKRIAPGGMVFHALNRGVGKMRIFSTERDYLAFERTIEETLRWRQPSRGDGAVFGDAWRESEVPC